MEIQEHPRSWNDWYRFARLRLGVGHDEAIAYANLRFVETLNRKHLLRNVSTPRDALNSGEPPQLTA